MINLAPRLGFHDNPKMTRARFKISLLLLLLILGAAPTHAQETSTQPWLTSLTVEGGPIASKHFQSGDENFRERHGLAILKIGTQNYGNWGVYFLNPNSVEDTSVGFGYVTDPYVVPLGPVDLEFTGGLGLVTGYQDYPLPLLAGEARAVLYRSGAWDAGLAMAAMPYAMEDDVTGDNEFGIVATSPFLSIRYRFE